MITFVGRGLAPCMSDSRIERLTNDVANRQSAHVEVLSAEAGGSKLADSADI